MVSAAGELDLRGGHPVLDFVNTVAWRGDTARRCDYLLEYRDVVAWCRHAQAVSADEAERLDRIARGDIALVQRALTKTRRLRESLHSLLATRELSALAVVEKAYASAVGNRELRIGEDGVLSWADRQVTVLTPHDRLAVAAVSLLTEIPRSRFKACGDAECGWLFLDNSHRRNRRWCSAADCGNRDRARRHYERSRSR